MFDAIGEEHTVGQAGERVVKGVVHQLDLVRAERVDGALHLVGETEVLDQGEHLSCEHGSDDAQPGDHGEQVDVTGLGALDGGRGDRDGEEEVGECDPPWRRPIGIVARADGRLERPQRGESDE